MHSKKAAEFIHNPDTEDAFVDDASPAFYGAIRVAAVTVEGARDIGKLGQLIIQRKAADIDSKMLAAAEITGPLTPDLIAIFWHLVEYAAVSLPIIEGQHVHQQWFETARDLRRNATSDDSSHQVHSSIEPMCALIDLFGQFVKSNQRLLPDAPGIFMPLRGGVFAPLEVADLFRHSYRL